MENIKEYTARKKAELKKYIEDHDYHIKTVVVQVGSNPASNAYIKGKLKDCAEVGIDCELMKFPEETTEEELLGTIKLLNVGVLKHDNLYSNFPAADLEKYSLVDGYIVQLPLPKHISETKITEAIDYHKDIDGFTKNSLVNPATPQGILTYLEDNDFKFEDANAVVIGRSNIVGKPMARLLLEKNCNVTVIHSKTSEYNKRHDLLNADLVVVATGHRNTIIDEDLHKYEEYTSYYRKPFIVDVGMNKNDEGKLCGDCEAVTVCEKTPVPGGVGLLTRLALLNNIVKLYEINHK